MTRKARVEGDAQADAQMHTVDAHSDAHTDARAAARVLDDAIVLFKQHFPDDWGECQNWPLQHAIPHLIAKLRSVKE